MNSLRNEYPLNANSISPSLFGKPTKRAIRAAVKQMILAVQARHGLSDEELAEVIGGCKETVANWRDESSTMNTEALLIFAYCYGEDAIEPIRALYRGGAPATEPTATDDLTHAQRLIDRARQKLEGVQ